MFLFSDERVIYFMFHLHFLIIVLSLTNIFQNVCQIDYQHIKFIYSQTFKLNLLRKRDTTKYKATVFW